MPIALFWGENWWWAGDLDLDTTFKTTLDQYQDGWNYVCGVVYSFGSHGNMAFEKDLLNKGEVHLTILF
jgi:hypothetical protein